MSRFPHTSQLLIVSLLVVVFLSVAAFSFVPSADAVGGALDNVFGTVSPPPGVGEYNDLVTGGQGEKIGLFIFMTRAIQVFTVVAGLLSFFNFILAGYTYVSSDGNAKANEEVKNRLTYSVIGLVVIVSAYTIIALLSLLIFGSATYILNPTITGPT